MDEMQALAIRYLSLTRSDLSTSATEEGQINESKTVLEAWHRFSLKHPEHRISFTEYCKALCDVCERKKLGKLGAMLTSLFSTLISAEDNRTKENVEG